MNHENPYGKNLKLAGIFLLIVVFLIFLSFLWRFGVLVAESRYDGKHQFNVEIQTSSHPRVVSFSPEAHTLAILDVMGKVRISELQKDLEIPIDAYITGQPNGSVANALWQSMFSFHAKSNINFVDKMKLWFLATSIHSDALSEDSVTLPISEDVSTNILQKVFLDKTIYQEAKTIAIVNASGISGMGGRLARLITDIGGNVIMVSTSQSLSEHSHVSYNGSYTYTNKRIDEIVHVQENQSSDKPVIADIMIVIGTDFTSTEAF